MNRVHLTHTILLIFIYLFFNNKIKIINFLANNCCKLSLFIQEPVLCDFQEKQPKSACKSVPNSTNVITIILQIRFFRRRPDQIQEAV